MIAYLEGTVLQKRTHNLIVLVNGTGFGVVVSPSDHGAATQGQQIKLYIYEHIREVAHDLYGFTTENAQELFERLLDAKGVGPKGAMAIMGVGSLSDIRSAIARGDTTFIARAPGVGKRVAERVVVDLKDKVGLISSDDATSFLYSPSMNDEAVQALMALGYSQNDATLALKNIDENLSTEERIRKALSK